MSSRSKDPVSIAMAFRAVCATVVVFLLAMAAASAEDKGEPQSQMPAAEQLQSKPTEPKPSAAEGTTVDWAKLDCVHPKEHNQADLCEQRRMSKAAENSVWLNQIQVGIGIVGGFLLFLTLYYSRRAAFAASDAAVAAQHSADAMVHAERPHMLMSELKVTGLCTPPDAEGTVALTVTYRLANYGRSPALLKSIVVQISCMDELPEQPEYGNVLALRFTVTVNGSYGTTKPISVLMEAERICEAHRGEARIWIFGYIEYQNVFGRVHKNRFAYRLPFDGDESSSFRPEGPDSFHEYT